jgi:signal transduction histidine kinase
LAAVVVVLAVSRYDRVAGTAAAVSLVAFAAVASFLPTTTVPPFSYGATLRPEPLQVAFYALPAVAALALGWRSRVAERGERAAAGRTLRAPVLTTPEAIATVAVATLVLLGASFGIAGEVDTSGYPGSGLGMAEAWAIVLLGACGALAVAAWWPVPAGLAGLALWTAIALLPGAYRGSLLAVAALVYCLARAAPRLALLAVVGAPWFQESRMGGGRFTEQVSGAAGVTVLGVAAVVGAAYVAALLVRSSLTVEERRRQLVERESVVEAEAALAAERARIARELHDVVAHHVSLVAVRAETAPYTDPDLPDAARAVLREIGDDSRRALDELRTILGVLRRADGVDAELAPPPEFADLAALVDEARGAGMDVRLVQGHSQDVPPAVGLVAYRVVQEALTNARRHAPGASVRVTVTGESQWLVVRVVNGPAQVLAERSDERTAGFGLAGMRERVAAVGGDLVAGPDEHGGYDVTARIPLQDQP